MIADDILTYIDANTSLTKGTDLFLSSMPDSPDNAVCVYDETGTVLDQNHYDNSDAFATMIKFRGSYSFIFDKIMEVHRNIAGLGDQQLATFYLVDTRIQTSPAPIGMDEQGRKEYTVHYDHYTKINNNQHRNNN